MDKDPGSRPWSLCTGAVRSCLFPTIDKDEFYRLSGKQLDEFQRSQLKQQQKKRRRRERMKHGFTERHKATTEDVQ